MADTGEIDLTAEAHSEFITEIKDDLELFESDLLAMEEKGAAVDADLINHAFRAIHSIKGGAGFCGLKDIGFLSHSMESVLMRIRDGRLVVVPEIVDALLSGLDKIKLMVYSPGSGEVFPYDDEVKLLKSVLSLEEKKDDDSDFPEQVEFSVNASEKGKIFEKNGEADAENFVILQTSEDSFFKSKSFHIKRDEIKKAVNEGKFVYAVHFDINRDLIKKKKKPADIVKDIEDTGDLLFFDLDPNVKISEIKDNLQGFNLVISTILDVEFLSEVLEVPITEIYMFDSSSNFSGSVESDTFDSADDRSEEELSKKEPVQKELFREEPARQELSKKELSKKGLSKKELSKKQVSPKKQRFLKKQGRGVTETIKPAEAIRVNVDLITRLMNFAGELVLSRNQLRSLVEEYIGENAVVSGVMQNLDMVTTDIQEDIMRMRMQPVGNLLGRFKRIIRDTAKKLSKKVEYRIEGGEVELDRTVIEGLFNPMTHLMRNCVDHGIEPPAQRKKAGKSETGTISVKAFHQGGNVHINIFDDGRGIEPEKIVLAAVKKGIITRAFADKMTDKEKRDLIFSPGFSISDKVTDVSGRGVGMDVVKTNIEKLRGHIDIESIPGQGTTVQLIIPLTLAIVSALIVGIDKFRFAIPQVNVSEVVFFKSGDLKKSIEKIGDSDVIRLRGRLLPVVRLRNILNIETFYFDEKTDKKQIERRNRLADRRDNDQKSPDVDQRAEEGDRRRNEAGGLYVVVIKVGVNSFGLCVEKLFDNAEIVVKPLSHHIRECRCFSGATILGDGGVIMILDALGMANYANLRFAVVNAEDERRKARALAKSLAGSEGKSVIVFFNAENEFFAFPLNTMARLEVIAPESIHMIGKLKFMEYHGTSISLFNLEDFIPVTPCVSDLKEIYVIIPKGLSVKGGIIVSGIVDTMEVFQSLQREKNTPDGVEGTAFIAGRLVQFLDMVKIVKLMENKGRGRNKFRKQAHRFGSGLFDLKEQKLVE